MKTSEKLDLIGEILNAHTLVLKAIWDKLETIEEYERRCLGIE